MQPRVLCKRRVHALGSNNIVRLPDEQLMDNPGALRADKIRERVGSTCLQQCITEVLLIPECLIRSRKG